jgi:hypothetical protein
MFLVVRGFPEWEDALWWKCMPAKTMIHVPILPLVQLSLPEEGAQ